MKNKYDYLVDKFDFHNIREFCKKHRVEVLWQSDQQYHCYIDYTDDGKSWAIEIDFLTALVKGIDNYQKINNRI